MHGGRMIGGSRGFASVVFDFDSTLSAMEGIDFLAGDRLDEVRAMTDRAMAGEVPLEAVYGQRLALIRPTESDMGRLTTAYLDAAVADAAETIAALRWLGKSVRVVSGGLLPPVVAAGRALGLRADEIAAVGVEFDARGEFVSFDEGSPLARAGGKAEVIRTWGLARPSLLVGDGATDLEARPAVDAFVAFMGVEHRPAVAAAADAVIGVPTIAPVLAMASSPEEKQALHGSRWAGLLDVGERALAGPVDA